MDKCHGFIGLIIMLLLVACGGNEVEQGPELVLPTAVIQEATTAVAPSSAATATFQPTAVLFPDTPTPPAVVTQETALTPTELPPTLIPSDVVVEGAGERPFISQDLLFIGDGDLRKWSRQDDSVTTLLFQRTSGRRELVLGEVQNFVTSADGTVAVAARRIPSEEWWHDELYWVNTVSGESRLLVENVSGLIGMALSPDGRSLLYVESDADTLFQSGTVYRLDLAGGAGATAVGRCASEPAPTADSPDKGLCLGTDWTRDSQNMLWYDAYGIWLRHLNANEPTLIVPASAGALFLVSFYDWSLNGRYLLLRIIQAGIGKTAVLDLVTNRLIDLPRTSMGEDMGYVEVDWMQDGRLFIIHERDEQGQLVPTLQLWRLTDGQLTLEETTVLQLPPHYLLQDAVHFVNGRFAFTLLTDDPLTSGLYLMASSNEQPQRVNGLPYVVGGTTWLYDNAGAILVTPGRDDAFLFLGVEPGEGVVYEIRPFLGNQASHFTWLPH